MQATVPIRAALLAASALTAAPAFAQDEPIPLDVITVTATRTEDRVVDTLAGASVVTRQTVDRFQPHEIGELFRGVPGVTTQEDGDDPGTAINIRGLQDFGRVNVMIEGARQNFQRSGHGADGTFYLEPELVRQVDIVRGPVSTIYGSGAIGGVVNFGLIDGRDLLAPGESVAVSSKGRYDTNGSGTLVSTTGAGRIGQSFDALANVVWHRDDSYKDGAGNIVPFTGEDVLTGLAKVNFRPAEGHTLSGVFLHQQFDYEDGPATTLRDTDTDDTTLVGRWTFASPDNPLIDFSSSAYYTTTATDQTLLTGALAGAERSFELVTFGTDVYNSSRFDTGPLAHVVTIGADAFSDSVETFDPTGTGDEFTPSGDRTVFGAYVQDQVSFASWLEVIGALRFDAYSLEGTGTESDGSRVSPKLTVGITPFEGVQLFGSYAEGYRAPAITEVFNAGTHDPAFPFVFLPNPDLRPETARNVEVGVNVAYDSLVRDDDSLRMKATFFHNSIKDFIEGDITGFNPRTCFSRGIGCGVFQYTNVRQATIQGFELEAGYDIGPVFTALAYSRIRGEDDATGEPLQSVRPDKLSATLGVRLLEDRLALGGRVTFVAAQDRVPASDLATASKAYELVDLFATYRHNDNLSFAVTLKNVLDEEYTKYLNVNPSEGFSASLSATIKFGA